MLRQIEFYLKIHPYVATAIAGLIGLMFSMVLVYIWKRNWKLGLLIVVIFTMTVFYYALDWAFWRGVFIYESPGPLGSN